MHNLKSIGSFRTYLIKCYFIKYMHSFIMLCKYICRRYIYTYLKKYTLILDIHANNCIRCFFSQCPNSIINKIYMQMFVTILSVFVWKDWSMSRQMNDIFLLYDIKRDNNFWILHGVSVTITWLKKNYIACRFFCCSLWPLLIIINCRGWGRTFFNLNNVMSSYRSFKIA